MLDHENIILLQIYIKSIIYILLVHLIAALKFGTVSKSKNGLEENNWITYWIKSSWIT